MEETKTIIITGAAKGLGKSIYKAANAKNPRYYYHMKRSPFVSIVGMLPNRMQDRLIKLIFKD